MEHRKEIWNNVEDPRYKLIYMLLKEHDSFARDMKELKMRVQEHENKLKIEQVIPKVMHDERSVSSQKWRDF